MTLKPWSLQLYILLHVINSENLYDLLSLQVNLVQKAVEADTNGKFDAAIKFYSEALEFLVPHIYSQ